MADKTDKTNKTNKMKILLVEDDPNTQSMLQMIMEFHDVNLTIVDNEQAMLDALQQQTPDMILLDIFLPGTDGYKLLGVIRGMENAAHCPIIATTAYYTTDSLGDLQAAGFDGYLLKPLELSMIMPYLEQFRHNQQPTGLEQVNVPDPS
jgi:CheY-like chemotaxis protein